VYPFGLYFIERRFIQRGIRVNECKYCGRQCENEYCCDEHRKYQEIYDEGKYVVCPECKKTFRQLDTHVKYKHSSIDFQKKYPKLEFISKQTSAKHSVATKSQATNRTTEEQKTYSNNLSRAMKIALNTVESSTKSSKSQKERWARMSERELESFGASVIQKIVQNRIDVAEKKSKSAVSQWASRSDKSRFDLRVKLSMIQRIVQNQVEIANKKSKYRSLAIAEGRFVPYSWISGYFFTKQNEKIYFASSYELQRFLQLEETNIEFKRYHKIHIPYSLDNSFTRNYTPDLLRADNTFEEIKPESEAKELVNVAKWFAAREFCEKSGVYKFETVFEDVLFRDISYVDFLKSMLASPLRDRIEITEEVEERIRVNCSFRKEAA
jgi:ssDNA-binding Zn-finger/Zn-ribbon topoisomerase 1